MGRCPDRPPSPETRTLAALLTPEGRQLVEALTPYDPATALALLERARSDPRWADRPDVVSAAATQARLRTRAAARFPGPTRWWTPDGLEQATRPVVAARHAGRFVRAGIDEVADLGCGAGSDALAMAGAGLAVTAVDLDPSALWALSATADDHGLRIATSNGDVRTMEAPWNRRGQVGMQRFGCFVDPARRRAGVRTQAPEEWSPPFSWVRSLADRVPATGAKVAPGIDHAALPSGAQTEWTSVGGDLLEACVWWGPLREGRATRTATVMATRPSGAPGGSASGDAGRRSGARRGGGGRRRGIPVPAVGPVGAWLVEPDPAVIRSGLVSVLAARIDGHLLDPRIAYIAVDLAAPDPGILGSAYAVLAEVPFGRKPMRAWLRARGYGDVVVKKRGINVVPEQLRAALRLGGGGPTATLILTRTDAGPLALLVERCPAPQQAESGALGDQRRHGLGELGDGRL